MGHFFPLLYILSRIFQRRNETLSSSSLIGFRHCLTLFRKKCSFQNRLWLSPTSNWFCSSKNGANCTNYHNSPKLQRSRWVLCHWSINFIFSSCIACWNPHHTNWYSLVRSNGPRSFHVRPGCRCYCCYPKNDHTFSHSLYS